MALPAAPVETCSGSYGEGREKGWMQVQGLGATSAVPCEPGCGWLAAVTMRKRGPEPSEVKKVRWSTSHRGYWC